MSGIFQMYFSWEELKMKKWESFAFHREKHNTSFLKFFYESVTCTSVYFFCYPGILWEVKCLIIFDWLMAWTKFQIPLKGLDSANYCSLEENTYLKSNKINKYIRDQDTSTLFLQCQLKSESLIKPSHGVAPELISSAQRN